MTYAASLLAYAQAGWSCILPVPPATKTPPPVGFTGAEGRDTDVDTLTRLAREFPGHSIALRMPDGVIGIDVDQYEKDGVQKRGAETLAACVERWGPLPATWTSTARGGGPSRIHLFRVPAQRYATKLTGPASGDVEIIQRHHRYAVVWPSPHPGAGAPYQWYGPDGNLTTPPSPEQLPELPAAWVAGLAEGATDQGPASAAIGAGHQLLDQLLDDWRTECADITSARLQALEEVAKADAGGRHDAMTPRVHHLVQLAAHGHTGVAHAVLQLRDFWEASTEGRAEEFDRMLLTSARKAVTVVGQVQVPRDPCLLMEGGYQLPGLASGDPGALVQPVEGTELTIHEPPRWASVREVLGTHTFDPNAGMDQTLAEAVLLRTYPALRYAYDTKGWLLRAPTRWELHDNLAQWAVHTLATLMPVGDPTAEKDSEAYARHQRRARFMTSAGAKGIAGVMSALVAGGMHPASVALSDLDADHEVLWAGGVPYSLRFSDTVPLQAEHVDPATPHLHSAAVVPAVVPTPLWDAFLESVWPDPAIRTWALRVLSIALTGYADRALPVLLGETGRGKTQLVALVMSVLGTYAHAADPRLVSPEGAKAHASIVFALKGRRLSFIDETPGEAKAGQERLKQLTGGGALTANAMNQNPITFLPTHTLVMTSNDEPVLTDPAVRSRVRLIPCDGDPEAVRRTRAAIGHLSSPAWRAEAPGVLAQLMREAAGWLGDPLTASTAAAPEGIRYLAENFGAEQDPVHAWLTEETEPDEAGTPSRELYQAFTGSCRRNNMRLDAIPTETKWGKALNRLGVPARHSRNGKVRQLRIRQGGFLPGMPAPTGLDHFVTNESLVQTTTPQNVTGCDGLVTGSEPNPSQVKPQVNSPFQVFGDGLTGLSGYQGYVRADAPAQGSDSEIAPTRHADHAKTAVDLREWLLPGTDPNPSQPPEPVTAPPKAPKSRKVADPAKAEAARLKRAQASEEKRRAAVAEASGVTVQLPAVVTRDGAIRSGTPAQVEALLEGITELTVDVEHTGYPIGHADYALRTVQLGNEHLAVDLDPHDPEQADVIRRRLQAAQVLHAHSATADIIPLAHAGLGDEDELWAKVIDTAILAKLADPSSTDNSADLKGLAKAVLGEAAVSPGADQARAALFKAGKWKTEVKVTTPVEESGWAGVDPRSATMVTYASSDVLDGAALAARLPAIPPTVMLREQTAQRMTARVASQGLQIDGAQVAHLREVWIPKLAEAGDRLRAFEIDNPGSDVQAASAAVRLGAQLPLTPKGKPSVAKGNLEPYMAQEGPLGDFVRARLDYQKAENALGLFLEPYRVLVERGDGRARPTVYTLGADTGRMSCVRPNLQQVPREGGFRACITADPGYLLISADFASVEIRVAAALSQDPALIQMVLDGIDMHSEIARLVWGPDFTTAHRYLAKRKVFGRIYGQGLDGMARTDGAGPTVAKAVIEAMDAMTPGLTAWSKDIRGSIESGRTQFPTASGRVIHLPKDAPHAGPNYCIQGTARELLIDALMRWNETPWGKCVLLPVHDEILAMVPEDQATEATATLVECMSSELAGVPIVGKPSAPTFAWADSE